MTRQSLLAAAFCLLACLPALSSDGTTSKDDNVVGARWEYTAEKDGEKLTGKFRAYKQELLIYEKKVGKIHPKDEDETRLIFTDLPEEKLNGEAIIRKISNGKKATWVGTLKTKSGDSWNFTAVLLAK